MNLNLPDSYFSGLKTWLPPFDLNDYLEGLKKAIDQHLEEKGLIDEKAVPVKGFQQMKVGDSNGSEI